jgi:hypothetical protein
VLRTLKNITELLGVLKSHQLWQHSGARGAYSRRLLNSDMTLQLVKEGGDQPSVLLEPPIIVPHQMIF